MEKHSEQHLLVHHLLNHSFKATQLKSGSFRVTVDGVPKALDILHKQKNNLSVSKGCYEERCWSSNKNLSKIPVNKTKTETKSKWINKVILNGLNILESKSN